MTYCIKCGRQIEESSKHCRYCGAENPRYPEYMRIRIQVQQEELKKKEDSLRQQEELLKQKRQSDEEERQRQKEALRQKEEELKRIKQERNTTRTTTYRGGVEKCPNCGCVVQSHVAKCPDCGFVFISQECNESVETFKDHIQAYDDQIAAAKDSGKSSTAWIVVNVLFVLIPLIVRTIYRRLIQPSIKRIGKDNLLQDEQKKAAFIENYIFPSDKRSIIEALLFIKSKVAFIYEAKVDDRTIFWTDQWTTKGDELKRRADVSLGNDKTIADTYNSINQTEILIKERVKHRAIVGSVLLIVYIAILITGLFIAWNRAAAPLIETINKGRSLFVSTRSIMPDDTTAIEEQDPEPLKLTVIDVEGKTIEEARTALLDAGFTTVVSNDNDPSWDPDRWIVVGQSYKAGKSIMPDVRIDLYCKKLCYVDIVVTSGDNMLFSKYDMEIYLDDVQIGTVSNGGTLLWKDSLLEGNHTLKAVNVEKREVYSTAQMDISGNTTFSCELFHGNSKIEFKDISVANEVEKRAE